MRFVEFALRGIRRFEGGRKLTFHEGYNVLAGPNESGKTICLLALLATLEVDRLEKRAGDLVPEAGPGEHVPSRCGLTVLHEGVVYRIVRDLEHAAVNLSRIDESGRPVTEQRDIVAVRRWLRDTAGMPGRRHFDALFVIERGDMPSASGRAAARKTQADAPGEAGPAFDLARAAAAAPLPTGAARAARIAELQAELAAAEQAGDEAEAERLRGQLATAIEEAKPGAGPDDGWASADLDVNDDGAVDRRDLEALAQGGDQADREQLAQQGS
jgi:hypothetical protein